MLVLLWGVILEVAQCAYVTKPLTRGKERLDTVLYMSMTQKAWIDIDLHCQAALAEETLRWQAEHYCSLTLSCAKRMPRPKADLTKREASGFHIERLLRRARLPLRN